LQQNLRAAFFSVAELLFLQSRSFYRIRTNNTRENSGSYYRYDPIGKFESDYGSSLKLATTSPQFLVAKMLLVLKG
jgi:hypothetical protein